MSKNFIDQVIGPVERFLDENIENGNIWYYIIGFCVLILYIVFF